jgi:hypothetical protein
LYDASGGNSSGEGRNLEGENFFAVLVSERVSGGLMLGSYVLVHVVWGVHCASPLRQGACVSVVFIHVKLTTAPVQHRLSAVVLR